jgi:hypothetical protein
VSEIQPGYEARESASTTQHYASTFSESGDRKGSLEAKSWGDLGEGRVGRVLRKWTWADTRRWKAFTAHFSVDRLPIQF